METIFTCQSDPCDLDPKNNRDLLLNESNHDGMSCPSIKYFFSPQENWTEEFSDTAPDVWTDNAISKSPSDFIGGG